MPPGKAEVRPAVVWVAQATLLGKAMLVKWSVRGPAWKTIHGCPCPEHPQYVLLFLQDLPGARPRLTLRQDTFACLWVGLMPMSVKASGETGCFEERSQRRTGRDPEFKTSLFPDSHTYQRQIATIGE